jgi:hypothetical protein
VLCYVILHFFSFYHKCQDAAETDPKAMHYIQILLSSAGEGGREGVGDWCVCERERERERGC